MCSIIVACQLAVQAVVVANRSISLYTTVPQCTMHTNWLMKLNSQFEMNCWSLPGRHCKCLGHWQWHRHWNSPQKPPTDHVANFKAPSSGITGAWKLLLLLWSEYQVTTRNRIWRRDAGLPGSCPGPEPGAGSACVSECATEAYTRYDCGSEIGVYIQYCIANFGSAADSQFELEQDFTRYVFELLKLSLTIGLWTQILHAKSEHDYNTSEFNMIHQIWVQIWIFISIGFDQRSWSMLINMNWILCDLNWDQSHSHLSSTTRTAARAGDGRIHTCNTRSSFE